MKFEQIKEVTYAALTQALGQSYFETIPEATEEDPNPAAVLQPIESYNLVDVGKDVEDSGTVDVYVKGLIVQLGKIYVESREFVGRIPSIFVDNLEWGGYVERVVFDLANISDDDMYNLIDGKLYEDDHRFYSPKAHVKIFEEGKAIRVNTSIVREQLFEAFKSWEQQNRFISGIYSNIQRTINSKLYVYALMLLSSACAISDKALNNSVHLLTEAKAKGIVSDETTAETALRDEKFLAFALERISAVRENMEVIGTAYNNGNVPTHTPMTDSRAVLLTEFSRACKFNVRANTFNEELLGIGEYDTVPAWQAIKDTGKSNYDFSTASTISIKADPNNKLGVGTEAVTLTNCIGIVFDYYAIGMTLHKVKVTSSYNASADFWNEFSHHLLNYIIDTNYNMCAFFID